MSLHNTQNDPYSQGIVPVWKHAGETLAVLTERFRTEQGLLPQSKITYAGRLDPMAEGVVIMLVGEARFQKDMLLDCEKTYELTVLIGVSTDTADMLGMVTAIEEPPFITPSAITAAVLDLSEVTELVYPQYSSRTVDGVPLFMYARAGTSVLLPKKTVAITDISVLDISERTLSSCIIETLPIIDRVMGDFRQSDIMARWRALSQERGSMRTISVTLRATVTSGTYMRALAEYLGVVLGVPSLAYRIVRTQVGDTALKRG